MSYYRQGPYRPPGGGMGIGVPRLTPLVKKLIIINSAIWIVQILASSFVRQGILEEYFAVGLHGVSRGLIWQPFTYMFLHSMDPFHLIFNMVMLWMFGSELERHWGARGFLNYYLLCGVGGGIAALLLELVRPSGYPTLTLGASGALFGLLVAFGTVFAERIVLFMLVFPLKARTMALIFVGINFLYLITASGGGVSHVAHLGGAVVGYLYLKRVWRFGEFYRELRWKLRRRRFKVMSSDDNDRWVN